MASSLKRRRSIKQQLHDLHHTLFGGTDGPRRGQRVTDKKTRRRYLALVRQVRRESEVWQTGGPRLANLVPYTRGQDTICEHCLNPRRTVYLVKPALVSNSENGDWCCVKCDPRILGLVTMHKLAQLVGAEESA